MKLSELITAQERARQMLAEAGIALTSSEAANIEVADFGLNRLTVEGLELVTHVNTERYCAKELVLFPCQTCPEHRHPSIRGQSGKQETFRCRRGLVWLYVDGPPMPHIEARIPAESRAYYTVSHQIVLRPGQQYTIPPNTLHWFQAGEEGAVVSEFSSPSHDESDSFTNPNIRREPVIEK